MNFLWSWMPYPFCTVAMTFPHIYKVFRILFGDIIHVSIQSAPFAQAWPDPAMELL